MGAMRIERVGAMDYVGAMKDEWVRAVIDEKLGTFREPREKFS